jgi:hypothetical protein
MEYSNINLNGMSGYALLSKLSYKKLNDSAVLFN